jgi:hypothetical protein
MNSGDHSEAVFRDRQGSVTAFAPCLPRSLSHLPHPVNPVHPVHSVVRLQIQRYRGYHILSLVILEVGLEYSPVAHAIMHPSRPGPGSLALY